MTNWKPGDRFVITHDMGGDAVKGLTGTIIKVIDKDGGLCELDGVTRSITGLPFAYSVDWIKPLPEIKTSEVLYD